MENSELDKWVAEDVMGWTAKNLEDSPEFSESHPCWIWEESIYLVDEWHPTKRIDQAFEMEEHIMLDKCGLSPTRYIEELGKILLAERFGNFMEKWENECTRHLAFAHATPLQRCRAAKAAAGDVK